MSLFQRFAAVAALSLSLVGLAGFETPGAAADVNRSALTAPAVLPTPVLPTPAPVIAAPVIPDNDTVAARDDVAPAGERFASLADAIAAQDQEASDDSLRCLATAIYYEARSEPASGQLAVAQVILNRAKSGRFPPDVCGVVTQRGQFSFVRGGELPAIDTDRTQYRTALKVAKVAMAKAWDGPAATALFFHARHVGAGGHAVVASIGNHVFFR